MISTLFFPLIDNDSNPLTGSKCILRAVIPPYFTGSINNPTGSYGGPTITYSDNTGNAYFSNVIDGLYLFSYSAANANQPQYYTHYDYTNLYIEVTGSGTVNGFTLRVTSITNTQNPSIAYTQLASDARYVKVGDSVTSSSYAGTASLLLGSIQSASYALTASFSLNGGGSSLTTGSTYPITASWSNNALSASIVQSASYAPNPSIDTILLTGSTTADFQAALDKGGTIWIQKGNYTVSNLQISKSVSIYGNNATLNFSSSATGFMLDTGIINDIGGKLVIENLVFNGGNNVNFNDVAYFSTSNGSIVPLFNPNWVNRSGLRVDCFNGGIINNCLFTGFSGNGVLLTNRSGSLSQEFPRLQFNNNTCHQNFIGIFATAAQWETQGYYNNPSGQWVFAQSEYTIISNNVVTQCQFGIIASSGNCVVTANTSTDNYIGLHTGPGSNPTHGIYGGNSFNHCVYAIWSESNFGGLYSDNVLIASQHVFFNNVQEIKFIDNFIGGSPMTMSFTNSSSGIFKDNYYEGKWGTDFLLTSNSASTVTFTGNHSNTVLGDSDNTSISLIENSFTGSIPITASWSNNAITASALVTTNNYTVNNLSASTANVSGVSVNALGQLSVQNAGAFPNNTFFAATFGNAVDIKGAAAGFQIADRSNSAHAWQHYSLSDFFRIWNNSSNEFFVMQYSTGKVGLNIATGSVVNQLDVGGNISCSVITASLFNGTANNALTASSISFVPNTAKSASVASSSISASYSLTASYALNGGNGGTTLTTGSTYPITASWAITASNALTASILLGSITSASYALSASYAPGSPSVSSSYALTASFALNGGGSSLTTGSTYPITSSWSNNSKTASLAIFAATSSLTSHASTADSATALTTAHGNISDNAVGLQVFGSCIFNDGLYDPVSGVTAININDDHLLMDQGGLTSLDFGNKILSGDWTGSISNAKTASYAGTASVLLGTITSASYALSSSYSLKALSASYAASSSVQLITSSSFASSSISASYLSGSNAVVTALLIANISSSGGTPMMSFTDGGDVVVNSNANLDVSTLLVDNIGTLNGPTINTDAPWVFSSTVTANTFIGNVQATSITASGITSNTYQFSSSFTTTKTGSYTISNADDGKFVVVNSASAVNITLTTSSISSTFNSTYFQSGSGAINFLTASNSVILRNRGNHTGSAGQYAMVSIVRVPSGDFVLGGDIA